MEKEQSILTDSDMDALKTFLVQHVRAHYEQTKNDLLLANVGWALNNQHPELRLKLGRRTVGQFVKREMKDLLEVPLNLAKPTEQYVYLKGQAKAAVVLPAKGVDTAAVAVAKPRKYAHAVILAFTRQLPAGLNRYLMLVDTVHFRDIPGSSDAPENGVVIDAELIVPPAAGRSKAEAQEAFDKRVDQWLQKHTLPLDCVLEQPKAAPASLWDHLLASLTETERKRIQLPLDIVAKLQNISK
jgi:hypothetical protein